MSNNSDSLRVCAFCESILDDAYNDSICNLCAERYGIVMHDSEDGCGCDTR